MTKEQAIKFDAEIRNRKAAAQPEEPLEDEDSDEEFITTGRQTANGEEKPDKNPVKEAVKKPTDKKADKKSREGLIRIKTKK